MINPYSLPDSETCYIVSTNPLNRGELFTWSDSPYGSFPRWGRSIAEKIVPEINAGKYGESFKPYKAVSFEDFHAGRY